MKKIFSFVLMAVALLVSTNMLAGNVAKIGTTEYATLEAAFNAVQDGETITLIDNIAIGSTVTINKANTAMTLNMAGKEWNFNDKVSSLALGLDLQAGTLTIKGYGAMQDTVASATFVKVASGATLTFTNGNFTNKGAAAAVENNGTLTVKSAWVNYIDAKAGKATINGATINKKVELFNAAEVVVLGGSINEIAGASASSKLTVKAGTVTTVSNAGANSYIGGTVTNINAGANTIEGGKFTALTATGATYTLKGGLFATNTFVESTPLTPAQGYSLKANTGAFSSTYPYEISQDLIKIVETGVAYGSLESAFAAVADGQTIQLQANIKLNGNMNLTLTGKTVTLDLNGKAWTLNNDNETQVLGMRVYAGNIIVTGNGSIGYDNGCKGGTIFEMYAGTKLTIENGTFTAGEAISSNGEVIINGGEMASISLGNKATALTINDGNITSQISLPSVPETTVEVEINGGTIENLTTMNDQIRGNRVTINGGIITWLQNSDSTFINDGIIDNINGGWCVIKKVQNKVIYFENDSSKSPYYRVGSFIMSGGIYSNVEYVCDEGKHSLDVAPGYGVFPNEDNDTKAVYPYEIRKAVAVNDPTIDEKAQEIANQIPAIATENYVDSATVGYKDNSSAKFLYIALEAAVVEVTTVKSITYDVKPKVTYTEGGNVVTVDIPNSAIKAPIPFRLSVDAWFAGKAVGVYHKGDGQADFALFGYYPVQEENGKYFVELASQEFSLFMIEKALDEYPRTIDAERWGTICYPYQILYIERASLFEPVKATDTELIVDSVKLSDVEAGKAYFFYAEDANPVFYYDGNSTAATSAENNNGLIGNMTDNTITLTEQKWVLTNNVVKPAAAQSTIGEHRAYIDLTKVEDKTTPAPSPGRRVFKIANTPTGLQSATYNLQPATSKMMINGQLVIIRDGKMFNAQGQEL